MRTLIAILILSIAGVGQSVAESLDVSWTHPDQREDGSALPLEEIAGYEIDWGLCSAAAKTESVGPVQAHTIPLPEPAFGEWCVSMRTVDSFGLKSATIGPVIKKVIAPPKPPALLTVESVVYDVRIHPVQGLVAHRAVGWVPLGAECYAGPDGFAFIGDDLYGIDPSMVAFSKPPKSDLIVARCAAADDRS